MPLQKRLPDTRADSEVRQLLTAIKNPFYRACMCTMYTCGLRIGEASRLPISAVDSKQMLLQIIGKPVDADLGGCWDYVKRYGGKHPITACQRLLQRTCAAVALILDAADELQAQPAESEAA